ncbi:class I SAM-dependent methyltransferase [Paracnuella aquatica]|uniref:class I SAM-dependent methyltransferase n=1 Tax=Paracnuella aquatica TaxID=2268757 RepID=UPI000DEF3F14|nr:class I SAM-dependent methyltransferase [Paracnuella aquatica]RPD48972.1 methyltransferase domain-containing protein [Paracnuella aquatica]
MSQAISQAHNTSFFNGIYQEVWRRMIHPGLTEAELPFLEDVCGLQPGQRVLDLMCGYGRHSLGLARKGYQLTSIDSSEGYVAEVQAMAAAEALALTALHGDVSTMTFDGLYDAAICMGNSFTFFNAASVCSLLQQLSVALKPGGRFVIDTWMIAEIAFRHFQERAWHQVDEFRYLIGSRYLMHPSRIEAEHLIITPDGKVETLLGVDYIFSIAELETFLADAGFALQDVFYTPRKRRFQLGDNRAYLVAVKS